MEGLFALMPNLTSLELQALCIEPANMTSLFKGIPPPIRRNITNSGGIVEENVVIFNFEPPVVCITEPKHFKSLLFGLSEMQVCEGEIVIVAINLKGQFVGKEILNYVRTQPRKVTASTRIITGKISNKILEEIANVLVKKKKFAKVQIGNGNDDFLYDNEKFSLDEESSSEEGEESEEDLMDEDSDSQNEEDEESEENEDDRD